MDKVLGLFSLAICLAVFGCTGGNTSPSNKDSSPSQPNKDGQSNKDNSSTPGLDEAKMKVARLKIQTIEVGIGAWKLSHGGAVPANLVELATVQPGKAAALLEQADLLDPWNQKYQYSPNQLTAKGMPVISTTVPGTKTVISNADK